MRSNLHPSPIALILLLFSSAARGPGVLPAEAPRCCSFRQDPTWPVWNRPGSARRTSKPIWSVPSAWSPPSYPRRSSFLCLRRPSRRRTFKGKRSGKDTACRSAISSPFGPLSSMASSSNRAPDATHRVFRTRRPAGCDFDCLVLTASRKEDDGYVLHAFGTGLEPLFSVPLEKAGKAETSVVVKDVDVQRVAVESSNCPSATEGEPRSRSGLPDNQDGRLADRSGPRRLQQPSPHHSAMPTGGVALT